MCTSELIFAGSEYKSQKPLLPLLKNGTERHCILDLISCSHPVSMIEGDVDTESKAIEGWIMHASAISRASSSCVPAVTAIAKRTSGRTSAGAAGCAAAAVTSQGSTNQQTEGPTSCPLCRYGTRRHLSTHVAMHQQLEMPFPFQACCL